MFFSSFIRPIIFSLDEELSHNLAIKAFASNVVPTMICIQDINEVSSDPSLNINKAGLFFNNPLGLAAGFDKNAEAIEGISKIGFGFIEVGTVTPLPQDGNPRPRLFRVVDQESIINRMGFNNDGAEKVYLRLKKRKKTTKYLLGINIGANKISSDRIADYVSNLNLFNGLTDYFTINISSPNTPGLRDLQNKENLFNLLAAVFAEREKQKQLDEKSINCPIFLKIAPDLDADSLSDIAEVFSQSSLDGIIVSNTTIDRSLVLDANMAKQSGGLSGKLLFDKSTKVLAQMRKLLGKDVLIIGAGGVDSTDSFLTKIKAGADLVQLYSGLVFKGPKLPYEILKGSLKQMELDNIDHISQYRDIDLDKWLA